MIKFLGLPAFLLASLATAAAPSYRVVSEIRAADGGWDLLSVDPIAERLFIARRDAVTAVDLHSGRVTDRLAPADGGHAAMWIPGTENVLVTNGNANTASVVDGGSGRVRTTIATGRKPDAAVYDPVTRSIWIMTPGDGAITVTDRTSEKVLATVPVGGSLELGAADGHGRLYVNVEDRNEIAVIDTRRRRVVAREPLPGCDGPTGLVFDTAMRQTVSACANGVAVVLSARGKAVASLPIGKRPDGAAIDQQRHVVLIPSGADGTLSVIQLSPSAKVIATVDTAKSARTIALDPSTGRAYLPAANYEAPVGDGRPKAIPGTFRILVVGPTS